MKKVTCTLIIGFIIILGNSIDIAAQNNKSNYKPFSNEEINLKVEKVFNRLTQEEKLAQLMGIRPNDLMENGKLSIDSCKKKIPNGIGHLSQFSSSLYMKPEELRDFVRQIQHYLTIQTHAGVPAIFHEEAITGFCTLGATTLPQQIGMSCTWNPELLEKNTQLTAIKMREGGATMALSPMIDIIKNAHWGRIEEGFGEDAYLTGRMGLAFVNGLQGLGFREGIAATTKHFPGYGGDNKDPREFYEETLFPYEVAMKLGGSKSLMPGYHKFDGVHCIANKYLLKDILRGYLGFDGLVVSDYNAMKHEASEIKSQDSLEQAAIECINAGADVELDKGQVFPFLLQAIKEGKVSQQTFDDAVKRELIMKAKLGLLDEDPIIGKDGALDFDTPEQRKLAYESACQSVVLLKNDGILPLKSNVTKIAIVGPDAATFQSLTGDYTYQDMSTFWWNIPANPDFPKLVTLLDGLKAKVGSNVSIQYERGCDWSLPLESKINTTALGDDRLSKVKMLTFKGLPQPDLNNAIKIAKESDVIIAAMGENLYLCGEGRERKGIALPGQQEAFVQKLLALGKPVILVIFGGRPQVITALAPTCAAILQAWFPGEEGGNAIADVLLGNVNPSGKLTVSYPKSEEQQRLTYRDGYQDNNRPLYPFGYGLSYTKYEYSKLKIGQNANVSDKWIPVSFKLKNVGAMKGTEIVQLYVSPKGIPAPIETFQLKGFQRVELKSGEEKKVTFKVSPEQLAYYDIKNAKWVIEPGNYEFSIRASSTDSKLKKTIQLQGDEKNMKERAVLFSEQ